MTSRLKWKTTWMRSAATKHGFIEYLKTFYFAPEKGLKPLLETKVKEIDPRETSRFRLTSPETAVAE